MSPSGRSFVPAPSHPYIPSVGGRISGARMGSMSDSSRSKDSAVDRRNNLVLRSLIDEMLDRLRELNRRAGTWSGDERARAEAELDAIMARVRRVASQQPGE